MYIIIGCGLGLCAGIIIYGFGSMMRKMDPDYEQIKPEIEDSKISKTLIVCICIGLLFGLLFQASEGEGNTHKTSTSNYASEEHKYDKQCKVCDRWFSDDSNKSSIRKTNMCSQCYKNYKYAIGE